MRQLVISCVIGAIILFSFLSNWHGLLIVTLLLLLLGAILHKLGKGIVLLEVTAILYVFTCLVMPLVGYRYYVYNNTLARLYGKYMPVNEETYFNFALPAIAAFCLAITLPSFKRKLPDTGLVIQEKLTALKQQLNGTPGKGLQIMIVGVLVSVLAKFLPASLSYFAVLLFFSSFAGLLYIHFTPAFRFKKLVTVLFVLFIMWNALQSGMFTIVAYMGITIFSFFQVGAKTSMLKKIFLMLVGIVFFLVLQNVKTVYRKQTLQTSYQGNKVELFSNLFSSNLQKGSSLLSQNALFPIYSRTNQGYNVALVMRRMPRVQPYDNGERLLTVLASAFVPRFLWSDKPESGGKFNMEYYAGYRIKGWSTNVGTLGEAYGSFGPTGGILYMVLLGLFLRWVYLKVFILSARIPLLICWLPLLFYDTTSSSETDTLQIINSIIKSAFFIWLLVKIMPQWFGLQKKNQVSRVISKPALHA
ncbi:MAG: hypothetical protein ABIQ31_12635 [Ferruginibacter sp.]